MLGYLRELFSAGLRGGLAYLLVRKRLRAMRQRFDPSEYGGAPLLGVNGVVIIAHGSSNARAIRNAIRAAADESLVRQVNAEIVEMLRKIPVAAGQVVKPAGKGLRALFHRVRGRLHRHPKEGEEPVKKPPTGALEAARVEAHPHESSATPSRATGSIGATGSLAAAPNGSKPAIDAAHDHQPDRQPDHQKGHQQARHDAEEPSSAQKSRPPAPIRQTRPSSSRLLKKDFHSLPPHSYLSQRERRLRKEASFHAGC